LEKRISLRREKEKEMEEKEKKEGGAVVVSGGEALGEAFEAASKGSFNILVLGGVSLLFTREDMGLLAVSGLLSVGLLLTVLLGWIGYPCKRIGR
jgi:hypothetical protein